jgi:hypothetical protein
MNPEFRRQLWLGFSATRVAVLPLLLLACFAVAFLSEKNNVASVLAITGAAMFAVLVWGMGTLAAGGSVMDEITDRTWDQQRMSAMQPWAMTWGKLGGATAYGWYGGALCLLVAAPAALLSGHSDKVFQVTLSAILFGLFLQALLIAVNLQLVKNDGLQARRGGVWLLVVVLLWGVTPLLGMNRELSVTWWGKSFNSVNFGLASIALCALCAMVAAWRSMAEVLAVRQLPWGWPALALLLTVYLSGFASAHHTATFGVVGVATCAALTYFALLTEPQPRPMWQRVVTRLAGGQWRAALLQLPRWPTTLLLAVPFALAASLALNPPDTQLWPAVQQIKLYPATFLLLMVRDCALALFFAFSSKNRRAVTAFLLSMFVLYILLPWLVSATGGDLLSGLVQPLFARSSLSFMVALIHAALAMALLRWRWRVKAP